MHSTLSVTPVHPAPSAGAATEETPPRPRLAPALPRAERPTGPPPAFDTNILEARARELRPGSGPQPAPGLAAAAASRPADGTGTGPPPVPGAPAPSARIDRQA